MRQWADSRAGDSSGAGQEASAAAATGPDCMERHGGRCALVLGGFTADWTTFEKAGVRIRWKHVCSALPSHAPLGLVCWAGWALLAFIAVSLLSWLKEMTRISPRLLAVPAVGVDAGEDRRRDAPAYEEEENANEGPLLAVRSPLCCVSTWAARRWPSTTNMNGLYAPPATPSERRKRQRTWGRALPDEMQKAASRSSCGST